MQIAGRCSFFIAKNAQTQYYYGMQGYQYSVIKCFDDDEEVYIECGQNGTWMNNTEEEFCYNTECSCIYTGS